MRFFFIIFILFFWILSGIHAQKELKLNNVKFEGNNNIPDEMLIKQMNTLVINNYEKLFIWKKKPEFISFVLDNDINRLKSYYNRNGFLNPDIIYKIDTLKRRRINVCIQIQENDFVKINNIEFNFIGDSLSTELKDKIKSKIPIHPNNRFIDDHIFNAESNIKEEAAATGYPFVVVNYDIKVSASQENADIRFDINPGQKCFFGDISIIGDSVVPQKFIQKHIVFNKGELYQQNKIDETQQDLFNTELFQYVLIRSLKDSVKENQIPVDIIVKELPSWNFDAGIGYGTDDRFRFAVGITKLNFFGGTRKLIFKAKTSYYTPYLFDIKFVQPRFILQNLDLFVNPFYIKEREKSYEIERIGGGVTFHYKFSKKLNSGITYSYENDNIFELTDLQIPESELKHNKSGINFETQFNTTNNIFDPVKGIKLNGNISYSGIGFNPEYHYYKLDFDVRKYIELETNWILATKVRIGVMQPTVNDKETPIEDRYFVGGAASLRGWSRNSLYPDNEQGISIGGNTLFEASAEIRFPVYDIFGGAFFMDLGNTWAKSYAYNFSELHYNTGLGFRIKTPIGPIRLDFATPIINDPLAFQFFISIGHAF